MELDEIIDKLKLAFRREDVKKEVLESEWYEKNIATGIDSTGFCYAACEVIYRLTGGKEKWKKVAISKNKWEHGGHCFLVNKESDEILDITENQYSSQAIEIPYDIGIAGGFRTKDYGKKAKQLAIMAGLIE